MALRVALISTVPPGERGSMGLYAGMVLQALREHAPGVDAVLLPLRSAPAARGQGVARQWALLREVHAARRVASSVSADVCHLLDGSFGYMATSLPLQRTVVTVHDLIPALQARRLFNVMPPGWAARQLIGSSLGVVQRAGAVHAISACTANDVHELTGRAVDAVIHNPLRHWPEAKGPAVAGGDPFALHVGNNGFYKNRHGVLRIFAAMARQHSVLRLCMAGSAPTGELVDLAAQLGVAARVDWLTYPTDDDLARLYRGARLLLFPSLYEGFGWPPLEAMALGCPSVCANTGSLPEVVGEAALLWDPADTEGFATQALRLLVDPLLVQDLRARAPQHLARFSAQALAAGLLPLYKKLAR